MKEPNPTESPTANGQAAGFSDLLGAAAPFIRLVTDADALPPHLNPDGCPLARHIPGGWPTLGELRKLVAEIQKAANDKAHPQPGKT